MNHGNGFANFAKKFNEFGNQLENNIKRIFNDDSDDDTHLPQNSRQQQQQQQNQNQYQQFSTAQTSSAPRRLLSSSDDVLGLDAEAFREATIAGNDGGELATYVNEKLVYEAGVDFDSRPMLVFAACRMLNPDVVDYDRLLNLILFRLDDFVESDYTVVLFAANARYKPNLKWLFTAYRRLGRKYKKNLKALYIVHPSKWVQILMTAMNAVLSPKFAKKVQWIDTLSELAYLVPIDQINIPPEVYQHNATKESEIKVPTHTASSSRFFAVPLERLMGVHGELGLPAPVADALDYLYTNALVVQDLFRRSPSSSTLQKVRNQYESEGHVSVTYAVWGEHVAAAMLKTWCRELPQPIIPSHYYEIIRQLPDPAIHSEQAAVYARDVVLPALSDPPCVSLLLAALFGLLRAIADHSSVNNMTSAKLAAAWAPNFVRSSQPDVDISMCSVTRFTDTATGCAPSRSKAYSQNNGDNAADGEEDDDDEEDDDILDLGDQDNNENRPNVVTLVKLMIDQYEVIFKPTLEAAEAQTRQQSIQRTGAVPPPKPPRRQASTVKTSTPLKATATSEPPVHASEEDIAALVEELGAVGIANSSATMLRKPVTADDITRRLQAEQDALTAGGENADKDSDEIVIIGGSV
ncbi:hypothetical protein LPJ73_001066 [Coemansia sp. RSA 2703]|nr:hypothetical protein LPJ73_001066 [Coemansia sp. RSA 2703]KAJ2372359.1 hypothetical protein IW150_004155 [Coemansia sp. RSA 2607]KAJ2396160.1 hypothetical protein GGI05_001256 [Coemansia sp. RSA 2603]